MPPIPVLGPERVIQIFKALGWKIARVKGSHIILVKEGSLATLSVPNHKEVASGTLRNLIRSAGMTIVEFLEMVENI
jgi:predicted RNA binding protein YcfA (HicA-like mRNA interferase family)